MPLIDDVNRHLRDFVRYTGDGLPNPPVGHPAPVGDPTTGVHNISKAELRNLLLTIAQTMGDPSALQDILDDLGGKADSSRLMEALAAPDGTPSTLSRGLARRALSIHLRHAEDAIQVLPGQGGVTIGWRQLFVDTPWGVRNIAARTPAFLADGQMLYIDLSAPYSTEYAVQQQMFTQSRSEDDRTGSIAILLHALTGGFVGQLAPHVLTALVRRASLATSAPVQATATAEMHSGLPSWDTTRAPLNIDTTGWYVCQPVEAERVIRMALALSTVDLEHFQEGRSVTIQGQFGLRLFAGDGSTLNGTTNNHLVLSGWSVVRVTRYSATSVGVDVVAGGSPAYSSITRPAMERAILLAGQSQNELGGKAGAIGGFTDEMVTPGLSGVTDKASTYWINAAKSGSAADRSSNPSLYWWDSGANAPGPMLTDAIARIDAAIAAGQPAPSVMIWKQGEDDAQEIQQGTFTRAFYKAALLAIFSHLRGLYPNLQVIVSPPGANDLPYHFRGMMGIRETYREIVAENAWAHYGHEMFDVPRNVGNLHPTDAGYYVMGIRDALAYQSAINGTPVDLGPTMLSAAKQSNGTVRVVFDAATALPWLPAEDVGEFPYGLCIVNGDPATSDPIPVMKGTATPIGVGPAGTMEIILHPVGDVTGARVYTIAGQAPWAWKRSYVRDGRVHGRSPGLPVRYQRSAAL